MRWNQTFGAFLCQPFDTWYRQRGLRGSGSRATCSLCASRCAVSREREPRGKALYCLFYEPSFLTRTSFERAAGLLGGEAHHTEDASQFFPVHNPRNIDDITSILASLQIDVVVIRTGDANVIERAAAVDAVPVINGGSPNDHPTQALADLYTLHREIGGIDGKTVAIVGRPEHRNVSALLTGLAMFDGREGSRRAVQRRGPVGDRPALRGEWSEPDDRWTIYRRCRRPTPYT